MTVEILLKEAVAKREISVRQAAKEIGVAHTTLGRIIEGDAFDTSTAEKIANWLHVTPSSLLDARGVGDDALAAQISLLLQTEPGLKEIFQEAIQRVLDGNMSPDTFRELAQYTAYRLNLEE